MHSSILVELKKTVLPAFVLVLLLMSMLGTGLVITVSGSTTHHVYSGQSIQDAINSAQSGDTIIVHNGTYYEHLVVNKTVSLIGEDKYKTIVDGNYTGTGMNVTASNVNITGFTIQNSGTGYPNCGILCEGNTGNNISHNIITNNWSGILLGSSSNNTLSGNIASNNSNGIYLYDSSNNNVLSGNTAYSNLYNGIVVTDSSNNTLTRNTASNNRYNFEGSANNYVDMSNTVDGKPIYYLNGVADAVYGAKTNVGTIYLISCNNVTIRDLTLTKNGHGIFFFNTTNSKIENVTASNNHLGIYLGSSSNNVLSGNIASSNREGGIRIGGSGNNVISGNTASNNIYGILLGSSSNNTLTGNTASNNHHGILLGSSSNNTLSGNIASSNRLEGIKLGGSGNNVISGNTASNNDGFGIWLDQSNNNILFHNNLINNTEQVVSAFSKNTWDDGYPSGGNYWDDYAGLDQHSGPYQNETGSDGIGDTSHNVFAGNQDGFPLMGPFNSFSAGTWDGTTYYVHTVSNSIVSDFIFSEDYKLVSFNVTGQDDTGGFCRVTIPNELIWCDTPEQWTVLVNNTAVTYTVMENGDYTYIYFNYSHSIQNVQIEGIHVIPEFPTWTSVLLILIMLTVAIAIYKRRLLKTPIH